MSAMSGKRTSDRPQLDLWGDAPVLILMVAALQVEALNSPPLPPAPPASPPFTRKIEKSARVIGARVNQEFKRCGDARTNSNGRYVEAMGTPAHSAEWKKASVAMENALTLCRGLRQALRQQKDFLIDVAENGMRHDAYLAAQQIDGVSSELQGVEQYFTTEAPRYRALLTVGWGNPHCVERPDGFMAPSSVCPKTPHGLKSQ